MRALSTYCETQKTMNIRNIYGILLYYKEKTRSALATHKSRYFSYARRGTSVYYLFTDKCLCSKIWRSACLVPRRLSLDENFEQRKAGRRKRASPRFLLLPVVHCVSSPVHPRFAPEEEAGEVLFVSLYKIISQNVVLLSFFTAINVNHSYVCFII